MSDLSISEVHALLDLAEEAIREVDGLQVDLVDIDDVPKLTRVVLEVLDWSRTAYSENPLGIQPAVLSKFAKMRGKVRKDEARIIADRVRSYLRSQDQRTEDDGIFSIDEPLPDIIPDDYDEIEEDELDESEEALEQPSPPQIIVAEQWVLTPRRADIQQKIMSVAALLESIVQQVQGSNLPQEEQALTQIEKAQLIAILETTLAVLRSPLIEKGILKKAKETLGKGFKNAAEKYVQDGLRSAMDFAADAIEEIIKQIF